MNGVQKLNFVLKEEKDSAAGIGAATPADLPLKAVSSERRSRMKTDVIIVGGGIGSLTCGSLLAKNGFHVVVLEQHSRPGGYVTSYKRSGFLFDVVHVLGGLRKGSPVERVFTYLGLDKKVQCIEIEKVFRFIYPDLTIDCYTDINKYEQGLLNSFPGERKAIHEYFETSRRIWSEILDSYYRPNLLQIATYPFRFRNLVKYQDMTYQEFLDRFFKDRRLKEILGSGWGYLGLNNPRISALYMIGMFMSYHSGGAWYPRGGYQTMSDAFADCFKEYGGTLRLHAKGKKILIEKGRAVGVELEDGERIRAGHVVSNADTKKTFLKLVGEEYLSTAFSNRIKGLQQSVSGFVVHLGVRMELPPELNCGCNMYFKDYGTAEKYFRLAETNEMETDPVEMGFGLSVSTMKDPALAPEGCHALDIIAMPAPYGFRETWMSENKEKYNELKERTADTLITAAEKLIPELSKHIIVKDINTPLTYERYTSATEGGWYDVACTPGQSLLKRLPARTPIKNLYLTGAKTFPGPGMFGAIQSGLFTADSILDRKLTKGRYVLNG